MNSQFIQEASETCFNGCCSSPFTSHSMSEKQEELEFSVITTGTSFLTRETKFTSQESLPRLRTSFYDLITAFPDYLQTNQADHLRSTDYENLSSSSHVFGQQQPLFSYSQFQEISESESDSLFTLSYKQVSSGKELLSFEGESWFQSRMRKRITSFMNLEESEYHMILTQDRSSAFKIVAELYSFKTNPNLLTVYNYEDEAVEEMIKISEKKGIKPESAEFSWPSTEIRSEKLKRRITRSKRRGSKRGLFVFPLQSLVTGASYSYSWMSLAHENDWHVLLDTSALGSKDMETLGLSLFQPDFLICSFTEVLGQDDPSGFGCLFVKKSSSPVLSEEPTNPSNLTVVKAEPSWKWKTEYPEQNDEITPVDHEDHKAASTSGFEIVEIESSSEQDKAMIEFRGLDHADSLGLILISRRSKSLTLWLLRALRTLQHPGYHQTEMPLVKIYGPKTKPSRGPSISFNIFDWQGEKVDPLMVERLAEREKIGLRCAYLHKIRIGNKRRSEEAMSLRLSVVNVRLGGFMTNFEDVFKVWEFVSRFLDADFVEKEKWRKKALEKNK
ncbi:hypothetical protein ISN44_As12g018560 [Arabidopsis suecica]|uniref:Molybdenum cofactor sulfurase n=1 Tax=Arabidopsis suecica TaxID=45249 RepID=A0A8T1YKF6_ARASU|nr:hypothetical protein ISN44_As12g018560 [Arabidopsis suecica]